MSEHDNKEAVAGEGPQPGDGQEVELNDLELSDKQEEEVEGGACGGGTICVLTGHTGTRSACCDANPPEISKGSRGSFSTDV